MEQVIEKSVDEIFKEYDADKNGYLDSKQMTNCLTKGLQSMNYEGEVSKK